MVESKNINKSLFFLTQVIYACAKKNPSTHIPFRNSALTKILRSSFGGNARTLLILCVSPTMTDVEISLSTLRFGRSAKKISNTIKPNYVANCNNAQLEEVINNYETKIKKLNEKVVMLMETQQKAPNMTTFL